MNAPRLASHVEPTLRTYLSRMSATRLLTPSEEMRLALRVKNGDEGARDRMIRANLRLVAKVAYDYVNLGLPLDDLISEL